ncbi:hypothetical protein [Paraburkholderia sp. EG304]|uniref:hypothetical protein n=1 Tax=Paraburkholderia sp. EG304 TaxID=3237015 RepID=UPI00397E816C
MKRAVEAAEAASTGNSRGVTRFGPLEFSRLPLHGSVGGKSGKFPTQPLGDQASGDGLTDSQRRNFVHGEVLGNRQDMGHRKRTENDSHWPPRCLS